MKRRSSKQSTDKKLVVANKKLWHELTESSQAIVCGGTGDGQDTIMGGVS